MTVDYDLVIIGGTSAGRYAAIYAAQRHARVALVEPEQNNWLDTGYIYSKAVNEVGKFNQQCNYKNQFGIDWQKVDLKIPKINFSQATEWAKSVISNQLEYKSPAVLTSLGIDVIFGKGEFTSKSNLAFVIKNRQLKARAYLIATGAYPEIPNIEGLANVSYITPNNIWHQISSQKLPKIWVVMGSNPVAIELAQTLVMLGAEVNLVVSDNHILPQEDPDTALLIQAELESIGIKIFTNTDIKQVKQIEDKKWVLIDNKALEVDEILLAIGYQPNIAALNLEKVGVKFHKQGIYLNNKMQTHNSCIYACGDILGGYQFAHIAEYEAKIAIKNALFLPIFKVDYRGIPYSISSQPMLARVGMTETQARRRYGHKIVVLKREFKTLDKAQMIDKTTGFCKIIVLPKGNILGAAIVGAETEELIQTIALAIRQNLKIWAIADLPTISPTLAEIIPQTAHEWHLQPFHHHRTFQTFLEGFFHWRRSHS